MKKGLEGQEQQPRKHRNRGAPGCDIIEMDPKDLEQTNVNVGTGLKFNTRKNGVRKNNPTTTYSNNKHQDSSRTKVIQNQGRYRNVP